MVKKKDKKRFRKIKRKKLPVLPDVLKEEKPKEEKKRKPGRPKKFKRKMTRLSITEMARRLELSRQSFYAKNKHGFTIYDLEKIIKPDFPKLKLKDFYTCPFMSEGKRLMKIGDYTLGVKSDGTVTLLKEEVAQKVNKRICVLCGIREGEETVSPNTHKGFHLTKDSCVMLEPNSWICYECCKECPEFDMCMDNHGF